MQCSSMAVATCFRLLATILLLAMAGRCYSQDMDHIQVLRIADSIANLTQEVRAQVVASEKVASGIMKLFTLMATDHLVCEGGWFKLRSSCYFVSKDSRTWEESRKKCKAMNSSLVKITHDDEYNFLRDLTRGHNFYIGLSDLEEEGTYRWVADGTIHQIVESWWGEGEPSKRGERCIHYFNDKDSRFNDINCGNQFRYICEKPAQLPGTLLQGYEETPAEK